MKMGYERLLQCFDSCLPSKPQASLQGSVRGEDPGVLKRKPSYMKTYENLMDAWQRECTIETAISLPKPTSCIRTSRRHSIPAADVLSDQNSDSSCITTARRQDMDESTLTFEVEVPEACYPGDKLTVVVEGTKVRIVVPDDAREGDILSFVHRKKAHRMPAKVGESPTKDRRNSLRARKSIDSGKENLMMEVDVPQSAKVGDLLKVMTPTGLCTITVPEGAEPGHILTFVPPKGKSRTDATRRVVS